MPAFDPNGAVRFDIQSGAASDTRGTRLVLLPAAALEALDAPALGHLGTELGRAAGARIAAQLGGASGVRSASLEEAVTHLAGEFAIAGLGAIHLERWGRALLLVMTNSGVTNDAFVGPALAGALGAATGREVAIAPLGREDSTSRYLACSPQTLVRVQTLVSHGNSWSEVIADLQKGGAS